MSLLDGCSKEVITEFGGAFPLIDPVDLTADQAVFAYNCEFNPKRVQPRRGFGTAWSPNKSIASIKYWAQGITGSITPYVAYLHDGTTVTVRNLATNVETDILTGLSDTSIMVSAPSGKRLYAAILSATGYDSHPGFVWDGNTAHTMDQTFQRPMLTTEVTLTLAQPGAGVCTQGTHNVGVLFQTRSGYWTRPGPAANSALLTLTPTSITAADSTHNMQATLHLPSGTWPSWIQAVQIIYTTGFNNFEYYVVPGTITSVTAGGSADVVITWSVPDVQIRAIGSQGAGTLADDYFGLLSMDNSNNPPFKIKFVIPWGNRMVWVGNYGGVDSFFPSDPGNPEWISADQHIQNLPSGLPISTAFVLRGVLYVVSPIGGIYAYFDNGGRPVSFRPPQEIDGSIGTPAPMGVTVDTSGNGYALIAAPQGLYLFLGVNLPDLPVSYYQQPDWDTIDWTKFTSIVVKDHLQDRNFFVRATTLSGVSQIFHWNYSRGRTAEKLKYSIWTIGASYPLGPIEIVLNQTSKVWELYIAPSVANAANPVLRQKSQKAGDTLLFRDLTATGIDWRWFGPPLPQGEDANMLNHIALRIRCLGLGGSGNLYVAVQTLDGTRSVNPQGNPFAHATNQDQHTLIPYDLQNEVIIYQFSNNAVADNAVMISYMEHYSNLMAVTR
jgi:hypothetical protein